VEKKYKMVATTMYGLEPLLKKELKSIGAQSIKTGNRCVYFTGDKQIMYDANIKLRTALKILKNITTFQAKQEKQLYNYISQIKWFNLFNLNQSFSVSSTVYSKYFTHSNYVSLVVKDAIVDQFRKKFKERPSINLQNPDLNIHIHISNNQCNVSLNSSGESLHKRGYRSNNFLAPMNEVLAAGLIQLSGWNQNQPLINPMCGSGTLLIEAALIAINRAPNIYRKSFQFQNWKDYDAMLLNKRKIAAQKEEKSFNGVISGFDISASTISIADNHIHNMKLNNIIQINGQDFFKSSGIKNSTIIINPPYGKRINFKQDYYKQIGDTLKQNYSNTIAWIISSEIEELKKVGLKPSKKIKVLNGPLECRFLKYELYTGSKKFSKSPNELSNK